MQTQSHSSSGDILFRIFVQEGSYQTLSLVQTLLPHQVVVLLGEWRGCNLAMVAPYRAFCTDHILAKQIHRAVDFDWLGEIIASSSNLYHRLRIGNEHGVPAGGAHNKDVTSKGFEWLMSFQPGPFGIQEPAYRLTQSCTG